MKHITFYFDVISPYAYLAFEQLPEALMGHSYSVTYKPILFAALLKHHGQLGPAEIPSKREWTYRQVLWLAQCHKVALQMPRTHPFNPLTLLRLAVACSAAGDAVSGPSGMPNRFACETLLRHVWRGGEQAVDAARLTALRTALAPAWDPQSDAVKAALKANTDKAISRGVFGVPTLAVDDKLFWGLDALPMLRGYLDGNAWFQTEEWQNAATIAVGATRRK